MHIQTLKRKMNQKIRAEESSNCHRRRKVVRIIMRVRIGTTMVSMELLGPVIMIRNRKKAAITI